MHRIPIIQRLFEATVATRRVATPGVMLTPVFYSIYKNGIVKRTDDIVKSVIGNPDFILCYVNVPHWTFGGNKFYIEEQFCYLDKEGNLIESIPHTKWSISEIAFYNTDEINEAHFSLQGSEGIVKYNYADLQFISRYKVKVQVLWDIFIEIDHNCNTLKEAEIYLQFLLKRLELEQANLTLEEYKESIKKKDNLIRDHKELLTKIEALVSKVV